MRERKVINIDRRIQVRYRSRFNRLRDGLNSTIAGMKIHNIQRSQRIRQNFAL
jgi:hypothetical protein